MHESTRFRRTFRRAHAGHPPCLRDEWLTRSCTDAHGRAVTRPVVWSRRNGPWQRHELIFVGAAPGNAGGKGSGVLGAHGTRIPFGGDIAGANLDVLLGSIGIDRNQTFLTAALNQLPAAGGGEPSLHELQAPVGDFPSSFHLLRDTIIACGPRLLVALGLVAIRCMAAALQLAGDQPPERLPSTAALQRAGIERGRLTRWPEEFQPHRSFQHAWQRAWHERPDLCVLLLTHPSGQNMSPYADTHTAFHTRMLEAKAARRAAFAELFRRDLPDQRPFPPDRGIYALPEWRELIAPRHRQLDQLWRARGV